MEGNVGMRALAWAGGVALAFGLTWVAPVGATTMQVNDTFDGNSCSGVFGQGFENCKIPSDLDPDQSPIIIKFNYNNGAPGAVEINSGLFPTIDGSEFSFVFGDAVGTTGTWNYVPGADDPGITFWTADGGSAFNLFTDDSGMAVTSGTWFTPLNPGGNPPALSHIGFYDTDDGGPPQEMPEPGSLFLLGGAVALLGLIRRRRR